MVIPDENLLSQGVGGKSVSYGDGCTQGTPNPEITKEMVEYWGRLLSPVPRFQLRAFPVKQEAFRFICDLSV